ncbi:MAG: ABC transporter substrate-binding protein [Dongiaceae bacterium]
MLETRLDRRRFLAGTAIAGSALLLRPGWAWSADGDTLTVRAAGDIAVLDPAFQAGMIEEEVNRCVLVSLIRLNDVRDKVGWTLHAASEMKQLDPTAIAFTLRDGLRWSGDWGPVTAEDVKFSFERVASPEMKSPWSYAFEAMDHVEVKDAKSGIIRLKQPSTPFWYTTLPYYMGHIVCKKAVEKAGGKYTTEVPATCGAYHIETWNPKQNLTLVANPDWKGEPVAFKTVKFQIIEDTDAAGLAYEAKSVDYTRISLNTLAAYKKTPPAATKVIDMPTSRFVWLSINVANPKLGDPKVRQAIQYALRTQDILDGAYSGLAGPATGVVPPGMLGHRDQILYAPDPEKAKALLKEAGVSDLSLQLAVLNDATSKLTAQVMQAELAEIGINLDIKTYDDAVYWTLGDKTAGDGWKSLELVLMGFNGGVDPSENLTWFRPDQIGVWNWSQFDSKEYEQLYQDGARESDPARREAIYRKMQDLMEESGGFVFITHEVFAAVHRDSIAVTVLADDYLDIPRTRRV